MKFNVLRVTVWTIGSLLLGCGIFVLGYPAAANDVAGIFMIICAVILMAGGIYDYLRCDIDRGKNN